jgi:hypothetical protein
MSCINAVEIEEFFSSMYSSSMEKLEMTTALVVVLLMDLAIRL